LEVNSVVILNTKDLHIKDITRLFNGKWGHKERQREVIPHHLLMLLVEMI
jgi:hypothetical protein